MMETLNEEKIDLYFTTPKIENLVVNIQSFQSFSFSIVDGHYIYFSDRGSVGFY